MNDIYIFAASYYSPNFDAEKNSNAVIDEWETGTLEQCQAWYATAIEHPDLFTASICAVVTSTDYETHPKLEGILT